MHAKTDNYWARFIYITTLPKIRQDLQGLSASKNRQYRGKI
jgi:hypothetical protein